MFFLSPLREGDVVSKKLESDHVRPVGSELRTRLRDRVGGTALTDLYATGTCISQSRSRLPLSRDRESAPERGDITDMSALRRDDKRAWLRLSTVCGPKEDGGIRPVVNLKALNSHVQQVPFKMEGIHLLKDILRPGTG